ncbi:LysR substrate-binding domain-containing protein [Dokdonella sp.]|uniref:LysR family transcriptional regulator n=1 Tax=Dokdonella sp. TaxID=2291710 RepID=UPI003C5A931F
MIDDLRSMAVFATVVGEGSFRGAAKRLELSPSVVSHHVSQLEKRLGCALLYRSTRHLSLTDDGRIFHQACARAVEAAEEGLHSVASRKLELTGKLRVTCPALLAPGPFVDDALAFSETYPGVELQLDFDDERHSMVKEGYDVAIRIGWLDDSALRARKLLVLQRVLCASPELVARHAAIAHPDDLRQWPWIQESMLPAHIDFNGPSEETCRVQLRSRITTNHVQAARQLAVGGAGVLAALDVVVAEDLAAERLVPLLPAWQMANPSAYAVWPANAARGSLVLRFVDFLDQRINHTSVDRR